VADPDASGPSWAALVTALVATRTDHATVRFDQVLAEAEAAGLIDGPTARTLRWWQRESVRAVSEHITDVLPDTIARMAASDAAARESVATSARAWNAVSPPVAAPAVAPAVGDDRGHLGSPPEVADPGHDRPLGTVTTLPTRAPAGPQSTPDSPHSHEPPPRPGPGFTSSLFTAGSSTPPGDNGAPQARLLAGGLTVLGDGPEGSAT
jgi:hypothetical protein